MRNKSLCAIILLLLSSFSVHSQEQRPVYITSGEWAPLMSESLEHYGILSHIVSEAMRSEGIDVVYKFYPWKRSFILAQRGVWDGTLGWMKSPDREKYFYFSDPIYTAEVVFFHLKKTPFNWESEFDLNGMRIGALLSSYTENKIKELNKSGITIYNEPVVNDLQNFKMLEVGRVQLVAIAKVVGLDILNKHFSEESAKKFTYHPRPFHVNKLHLLFSRTDENGKQYVELFNKGLRKLKESNRLDEMWEAHSSGMYHNLEK